MSTFHDRISFFDFILFYFKFISIEPVVSLFVVLLIMSIKPFLSYFFTNLNVSRTHLQDLNISNTSTNATNANNNNNIIVHNNDTSIKPLAHSLLCTNIISSRNNSSKVTSGNITPHKHNHDQLNDINLKDLNEALEEIDIDDSNAYHKIDIVGSSDSSCYSSSGTCSPIYFESRRCSFSAYGADMDTNSTAGLRNSNSTVYNNISQYPNSTSNTNSNQNKLFRSFSSSSSSSESSCYSESSNPDINVNVDDNNMYLNDNITSYSNTSINGNYDNNNKNSVSSLINDKWWIGGRGANGDEKFYLLQVVGKLSSDAISIDRLSI